MLSSSASATSRLFAPFRSFGVISVGNVAADLLRLGSEYFLTTSVGRGYHIYNLDSIRLVTVSSPTSAAVCALASYRDCTYVATEDGVVTCFHRGKPNYVFSSFEALPSAHASETHLLATHPCYSQLMVCGEYLAGLSTNANHLAVWRRSNGEMVTLIEFGASFTATSFMHPHTYMNKLLVASSQGTLQLWNIVTNCLIYEFASFSEKENNESLDSPAAVTVMAQSPVTDVVAIGFDDGTVVLHNLRVDEPICKFLQDTAVTALAFRSDNVPMLASAGSDGSIVFWDLEKRRVLHNLLSVHTGGVHSLHFLIGEPVLVSAGPDNCVRMFLFDSACDGAEAAPRPLRERSGHAKPPGLVRFYGDEGRLVVTAGGADRSLRIASLARSAFSHEFSQGAIKARARKLELEDPDCLRLTPAMHVECGPAAALREFDWPAVLSAHVGDAVAHTWSFEKRAIGTHKLWSPDNHAVTAIVLSACGNFAIVGSAAGSIAAFALQSGLLRRADAQVHRGAVVGLAVDSCNTMLISGGRNVAGGFQRTTSAPCTLHFHDFAAVIAKVAPLNAASAISLTTAPKKISLGAALKRLLMHSTTTIMAAVCDSKICIVDCEARKVVRVFTSAAAVAAGGEFVDATFSRDGRLLVACMTDSCIRTWDVPSGTLVDVLCVAEMPTSLAMSPAGDLLACTFENSLSVSLYVNRASCVHVSLRPIVEDALASSANLTTADACATKQASQGLLIPSALPDTYAENDDVLNSILSTGSVAEIKPSAENSAGMENAEKDATVDCITREKLDAELVSVSSLPRSRWLTCLLLDTVRLRNRPVEPPKESERAPFFLPTEQGLAPKFSKNSASDGGPAGTTANAAQFGNQSLQGSLGGSKGGFENGGAMAFASMDTAFSCLLRSVPFSAGAASLNSSESLFAVSSGGSAVESSREIVNMERNDRDSSLENFFNHAVAMPPARLDLELRLLEPELHNRFLEAINRKLDLRTDFEMCNTMLNIFLRGNSDALKSNRELKSLISAVLEKLSAEWSRMQSELRYSNCMLGFIRDFNSR